MSNLRPSRVKIEYNEYKGGTSSINGHNQDTMIFNLDLIARRYPMLAVGLVEIYENLPLFEHQETPIPDDNKINFMKQLARDAQEQIFLEELRDYGKNN